MSSHTALLEDFLTKKTRGRGGGLGEGRGERSERHLFYLTPVKGPHKM